MRRNKATFLALSLFSMLAHASPGDLSGLDQKVTHLFKTLEGPSLVSELRELKKSNASPLAQQIIERNIVELSQSFSRPEALAAGPSVNELSDKQLCNPHLIWMMKLAYVDFGTAETSFVARQQQQIQKHRKLEESALTQISGSELTEIPSSDERNRFFYSGKMRQFERIAENLRDSYDRKTQLAAKYTLAANAPRPMAELMGISEFKQGIAKRASESIKSELPVYEKKKALAEKNLKKFKEAQEHRATFMACTHAAEIAQAPREDVAKRRVKSKTSGRYLVDVLGDGKHVSRATHPHLYSEYWETNSRNSLSLEPQRTTASQTLN